MNIEIKHLKAILAIRDAGSVARAALQLNMTQSALSHQIRQMKETFGVDIFVKNAKPVRLSAEGQRIVDSARRILLEIDRLKNEIIELKDGQTGRLYIAIECHACFEWLFPALNAFRASYSEVDIDIKPGLAFRAMDALRAEELDVVITADPENMDGIVFEELFSYEACFVASVNNRLANKDYIEADDFSDQTVITYPVPKQRLDLFNQLLIPAGIEPLDIRQVELTAVILLLVGANKGVSVLPDWVIKSSPVSAQITVKQIGPQKLYRKLYAAIRSADIDKPYMQRFLSLCRSGELTAKPR